MGRPTFVFFGVAVNVFESVGFGIGNRHEFDHSIGRVGCQTGCFFKLRPAQKVLPDGIGHAPERRGHSLALDDVGDVVRA